MTLCSAHAWNQFGSARRRPNVAEHQAFIVMSMSACVYVQACRTGPCPAHMSAARAKYASLCEGARSVLAPAPLEV